MQTVFEVENLKPLASAHSCNLLRHLEGGEHEYGRKPEVVFAAIL